MRTRAEGRMLDIVFPCSVSVAGNRMIGNRRNPGIDADFGRSFARLERLQADVVLPSHPELADVIALRGRGPGAYVRPGLLGKLTRTARAAFAVELAKQRR
jgi:metallo-beta-lactamase class B